MPRNPAATEAKVMDFMVMICREKTHVRPEIASIHGCGDGRIRGWTWDRRRRGENAVKERSFYSKNLGIQRLELENSLARRVEKSPWMRFESCRGRDFLPKVHSSVRDDSANGDQSKPADPASLARRDKTRDPCQAEKVSWSPMTESLCPCLACLERSLAWYWLIYEEDWLGRLVLDL